MRFWDIASGQEVRRVAAAESAFVAGTELTELKTYRHFLKATDDTLVITRKREIFIDNRQVRVHCIIEMIVVDRPCAMGV